MTKVIVSKDCGNSPKNSFLEKLTVAFAKGDAELILSKVSDDVRWKIVGEKEIRGKDDLAETLEELKKDKAAELKIAHIVSHGKAGAVDGTLKLKDKKTRAFCDVYEFSNAKGTSVKKIISYRIESDF